MEELAVVLRENGVTTYVSHSSISAEERRAAEAAFATESNCVIVATSTLELGVDAGDLDHVIQIDAPTTVASFLQLMGRTGRRTGSVRNTLFLATDPTALWLATALVLLWQRGFVEALRPPPHPRHILAQQVLGLLLQERRLVGHDLWEWLGELVAVPDADVVMKHLVEEDFVVDDGGLLAIGPRAEQEYGRRYFLDLTSSFTSEPMLEVLFGRRVLGSLPPIALAAQPDHGRQVVLLGGRSWDVDTIDWRKRRVWVEPSKQRGRSRWNSGGRSLSYELARAHHDVLAGTTPAVQISRRAQKVLEELRQRHDFVSPGDRTYLVPDSSGRTVWWTFAGFAANSGLAEGLSGLVDGDATVGDLRLRIAGDRSAGEVRQVLDEPSCWSRLAPRSRTPRWRRSSSRLHCPSSWRGPPFRSG